MNFILTFKILNRYLPILFMGLFIGLVGTTHGEEKISYNDSIRPIFNTSCVGCHGGVKKSAGVSFIYREEALGVSENGKRIIVAGDPEASELYRRISSDDSRYVMPPAEGDHHHEPLDAEQISLIAEWIRQGAEWEEHWAYIKPERREVSPRQKDWIRTPMDAYVLAKLEAEDLSPTAEAPRAQWLRRVTLDLTGLPPTVEEREAFLNDDSPEAHEKVVDHLLASPRYGERWAAMWMDLARYADTKGFEKDPYRDVWPYRDWLINAFNADLPYDDFIRDQLAGDLVDDPTTEQLMATIFVRLTQTNDEGGTDDEEYRVAAVLDRINTTWSSFQGVTFSCVQCHGHPYEPIPHEDYYRFMSFFNSTEDCDQGNDYPLHKLANDRQRREEATRLQLDIPRLRRALNEPGRLEMMKPSSWTRPAYSGLTISSGGLKEENGILVTDGTQPPNTHYSVNLSVAESGRPITALKFTILPDDDRPEKAPFRGALLSRLSVARIDASGTAVDVPLSFVYADAIEGPLALDPRQALNNSRNGVGGYPKLYRKRESVFVLKDPLVLGAGEKLKVSLRSSAATTGGQNTALRRFLLEPGLSEVWPQLVAAEDHQSLLREIAEKEKTLREIKGLEVPVAAERFPESARETRLFVGGNRHNKGEVFSGGVPDILNQYEAPAKNRLEMASWLTHPDNSLTARVFVNRIFFELFGNGIVQTLGDFGSSGLPPTNLPLLDHLAIAFSDDYAWRLKPLLKEMVLSAVYRQDHKSTPELSARDPKNLLLARGPRTRLTAEMVRDQALSVSGLIEHRLGGASVMPPQPEGVWSSPYSGETWKTAKGPDRYRRALYTYWKRTAPYPSMVTFDAPAREVCSIRRITTNIPLQPLVTLNDPAYLECAQRLAQRMREHPEESPAEKIAYGHVLATQREAPAQSLDVLASLYEELRQEYERTSFENLAANPEEAAWVNVAGVLLNIDNALTK